MTEATHQTIVLMFFPLAWLVFAGFVINEQLPLSDLLALLRLDLFWVPVLWWFWFRWERRKLEALQGEMPPAGGVARRAPSNGRPTYGRGDQATCCMTSRSTRRTVSLALSESSAAMPR